MGALLSFLFLGAATLAVSSLVFSLLTALPQIATLRAGLRALSAPRVIRMRIRPGFAVAGPEPVQQVWRRSRRNDPKPATHRPHAKAC